MFKKIKKLLLGDASTDIAFRYLPVVELIKKNKFNRSTILEIGSGDLGITPYYSGEVIGIDISFDQPSSRQLKKIKIDGPIFPFKDNEFETSISIDVFEHIKPEERLAYFIEIFRVTRKGFILVLPVGNLSYEHDKKLGDYFFKIHNKKDKFINEHLENNLPSIAVLHHELFRAAELSEKKIELTEEKKLLNLTIRQMLMEFKISKSRFKKIIYFSFLSLARFQSIFNFGECYRRLFFIKIK